MGKKIATIVLLFVILFLSLYEGVLWIIGDTGIISPYFVNIAIFVIAVIAIFVMGSHRPKNEKKVYVKKDKDSISITESAMTQLVDHTLDRIGPITEKKIAVDYDKDQNIILKLILTLEIGSNVLLITEEVERSITEAFEKSLGEKIAEIKCIISGFSPRKNS